MLTEYLSHYNTARPHRALDQLTPAQADTRPPEPINLADHRIRGTKSSADSPTSTTSPPYRPALLRENVGHPAESYSEPHRVATGGGSSRAGGLFQLISRVDGVKMLLLSILAVSGMALARRARALPPRPAFPA